MLPPRQELTTWFHAWRQRLAALDFGLLMGGFIVVLGILGFVKLMDAVEDGKTQSIDERLLRACRNPENLADTLGPPWVEEAVRDVTALGGVFVLTLVTALVVGFYALRRDWKEAGFLLVAVGGGLLVSFGLKSAIDRPRPDLVPHLSHVVTTSFPSAHAQLSAVVYLTLGALLAEHTPQRRLKVYFLAVGTLLTLLVGCSRVYLGVHYPTDVLAGWAAGFAWAALGWMTARRLLISDPPPPPNARPESTSPGVRAPGPGGGDKRAG
jgi:undecaprenyl-diphosphatase